MVVNGQLETIGDGAIRTSCAQRWNTCKLIPHPPGDSYVVPLLVLTCFRITNENLLHTPKRNYVGVSRHVMVTLFFGSMDPMSIKFGKKGYGTPGFPN